MKNRIRNVSKRYLIIIFVIVLSELVHSKNLAFKKHTIDLNFDGIHQIKVIDLDKDGDYDIVGGSEITPWTASKGLAWWRNEGNNNWTRFTIDANFIHVMSVDTADINNDSYTDIIAASWHLNQIVWLKNSGDPTQGWTKYIIKSGLTNAHDVRCADIDNDNDMDVVGTVSTPGSIVICENDGSLSNWPITTVTNSFAGALALSIADMDSDSHLDIIATASNANQVAWWNNNGGNPSTWPKNLISSNFVGASGLDVVYMNNDSLLDVVSNAWKSSQVAYWICNDIQSNFWSTKYTVSTNLDTPVAVQCGDLDIDGDMDIVAVGKIPGELVIYENTNFIWNGITLENNFYGGSSIEITDLDNDGDDDIIACASYIGELYWWENTLITSLGDEKKQTKLPPNYEVKIFPNPFNLTTTIEYSLIKAGNVEIVVFNSIGQQITKLKDEFQRKGVHKYSWNVKDLPSAVYYVQLKFGNQYKIRKVVFLK